MTTSLHDRTAHPVRLARAVAAGAIGTGVLTALWLVEPSIGLPGIAVGQILSSVMSVSVAWLRVGAAGGWAVHLAVGIVLAIVYAMTLAGRTNRAPALEGALFGVMVFVVAQLTFMPLVGAGLFSRGDVAMLAGSLLGHLAYGATMGWIYALPERQRHSTGTLEAR